jgi:bifunctional enzyme CysN/CysC
VASGVLRPGDEVTVLPSGGRSTITHIETFDGAVDAAYPPMSVTVNLADDLDVSRGDVICRPHNHPLVSRDIDAVVCWMGDRPAAAGTRYAVKHTTRSARAVLKEVLHRIDVDTLHRDEAATDLGLNEIGRITLRTSTPLVFDPYSRNRITGSFILVDEATNDTVGAGMILGAAEPEAVERTPAGERSANVTWQPGRLTRDRRWSALGRRGATVWLTGLPASGKSTIAGALEERLVEAGVPAYRLDGDNLRHGLNQNLGFDPADRAENVRRTAHAARLLADAGTIAIVSLVSPYAADRATARAVHEQEGIDFLEVFVDTPLDECERRDPKGLYARARAGELEGMTGVDDPYEAPAAPDIVLTPADAALAVDRVLAALRDRGVMPA